MTEPEAITERDGDSRVVRTHLLVGWAGLFLVVLLGTALEAFHAFKLPQYLDVEHTTRRLVWRLAHAHAGVLSLVSIAFSWTVTRAPGPWQATSRWLLTGSVLVPLGFFLGGFGATGGDPGPFILLVPLGAVCLLVAFFCTISRVPMSRNNGGSVENGRTNRNID